MIIAFGNKARHGKDTACEAIQNWYAAQNKLLRMHGLAGGMKMQKVNFADALRKEVTAAIYDAGGIGNFMHYGRNFGWDGFKFPEWVELDPKAPADPLLPHGKHAKILQWWGTDYRRSQNQNYWVDKWLEAVKPFQHTGLSLTGDMRFINEADAVKSVGGAAVNVSRLLKDGTLYVDPSRPANHPSETELDGYNFDFYIKVVDGHIALVEQFAVALAEYLRALETN